MGAALVKSKMGVAVADTACARAEAEEKHSMCTLCTCVAGCCGSQSRGDHPSCVTMQQHPEP